MVDAEDASGNASAPPQASGSRKIFWRSASWSTSRSFPHNPDKEELEGADPNGNSGNGNGTGRRFPAPVTPRSQHNSKGRPCLPPLQPLSIARRSLDEWPKAGSDDVGEWPLPSTPSGRGNAERLKLDLSTIQKVQDRNGGLVKRDKIAFFDRECSKVEEHVYLGGDAVARDRDILRQNGITHILNCVGFVCPEYFKTDFTYRTLWLQDSPSEDITSILYDVFDYFEDVRELGGRVFVHCCQGVSRSTSLVIAYLMWREGQSFDDAFQYVKAARGIADPNMGFACQLLQCQKRVHAFPLSPSSLLRMYRIAPHSPYDPLHLVPKMLNDPSPCALDSRGAFIIHIPSAIYLWVGKKCEAIMERDARGAACQIVRYEKVQGSITVIKEEKEPASFWDAFSSLLPLMYKSGDGVKVEESKVEISPGERKVDSYNVDYEIFQKAILGGFVPPFASSENEHETHLPARESSWSMLRRKFASGHMKEFVSAPKIALSRVYSDSKIVILSSAKPLSPSSSSSSSLHSSVSSSYSPIYLSPDSISSDTSTSSKYFSESSLDSPSEALPSVPSSTTMSSLCNMSLHSSKNSSLPIPNGPEVPGAMMTSKTSIQSSPKKKLSPSLAERRGSLSKFLKLPKMSDNLRVTNNYPSFRTSEGDDDKDTVKKVPESPCSFHDPNNLEYAIYPRHSGVNSEADLSKSCNNHSENSGHQREKCLDAYQTAAKTAESCGKLCRQHSTPVEEGHGTRVSNKVKDGRSVCNHLKQPLVYRWPGLEKISMFSASDLDSKAAFSILSASGGIIKSDGRILYFWVGRSFDHHKCQTKVDASEELDCQEQIDWNKISRFVLAELDLPDDIVTKVVKEGEEPDDFLALLNESSAAPLKLEGRSSSTESGGSAYIALAASSSSAAAAAAAAAAAGRGGVYRAVILPSMSLFASFYLYIFSLKTSFASLD